MKKNETCEGRKLDYLDCKPVRKFAPGFLRARAKIKESTKNIIFIPDSAQGYLFENGNLYRFGLPEKYNLDHVLYGFDSLIEDQNKGIHCCETKQAMVLSDYKHHLHVSPLHQIETINESVKDLQTILSFNYQLTRQTAVIRVNGASRLRAVTELNDVLKRLEDNVLIAVVSLGGRFGIPAFNCWAWEKNVNGKTERILITDNLAWRRNRDSETRLLFDTLKNELTGFFYPQKVKDVLGGFEL
jgi:hypothetical protein